jgi:DNA-binding transcriptional LysR family regulator
MHGIGIALLPEQVISTPLKERLVARIVPECYGARNILHLVYPMPRGMLPSGRSLFDYLLIDVPAWLREHSIQRLELFNSAPSVRQRACPLS